MTFAPFPIPLGNSQIAFLLWITMLLTERRAHCLRTRGSSTLLLCSEDIWSYTISLNHASIFSLFVELKELESSHLVIDGEG